MRPQRDGSRPRERSLTHRLALLFCCVILGWSEAVGQGSVPASPAAIDPATKRAQAVRLAGAAIQLDGRLDDTAWRSARWLSDFVQKEPNEGAEPTERTEFAFLYDGDALYVGARMYADDPAKIQAPLARRDNGSQAEHVWISLDTYRDRRTAYSFGVTASGARMDWYHATDHESRIDPRFDPVWEARAVIDSLGWTAEMRIPFSQLRFTTREVQVWGLNIDRWIPSRREDVFWVPVPKNETGWSSRMGELHGITGIRPSRRLEVLPYAASDATLTADPHPADPFDDGTNLRARAGVDVKMGLGPNLTLDATINPDFGQVEADPAVVNLSAFEVFFDERRPFFTEGQQLFPSRFFYSRRVGARPRGEADGSMVMSDSATCGATRRRSCGFRLRRSTTSSVRTPTTWRWTRPAGRFPGTWRASSSPSAAESTGCTRSNCRGSRRGSTPTTPDAWAMPTARPRSPTCVTVRRGRAPCSTTTSSQWRAGRRGTSATTASVSRPGGTRSSPGATTG